MNAKERLDAFYAGQSVDRLPNLAIVGSAVTRYTGIDLEQYCKDPIAMADSCTCGAYIIDIDHATDFRKALETVNGRCVLNGNIDPVADVFSCDAAHTKAAILHCAEMAAGYRAMFMPGCELPTSTPTENIRAIHEALFEIGSVQN